MTDEKVTGAGFCVRDVGRDHVLSMSRGYMDWTVVGGLLVKNEAVVPYVKRQFHRLTGVRIPSHLISLRDDHVFTGTRSSKEGLFTVFYIPINADSRKHFKNCARQPGEGVINWTATEDMVDSQITHHRFHRDMLEHFGVLSVKNLSVTKDTKTMSIENFLFRDPDCISHYQRLTRLLQWENKLIGKLIKSNDLVKEFKKLFGEQARTFTRGTRYWIWERGPWRIFVTANDNPTIEINSLCGPEQALDAYEDYLTQFSTGINNI